MVEVKLDQLAKKLGKSISDIARETGLNRNSVTALFHHKVDGIKFETLEKICQTYQVGIAELLEMTAAMPTPSKKSQLYRQEAEISILTIIIPGVTVYTQNSKFIPEQLGDLHMYIQKEYTFAYWDLDAMRQAATKVYQKYSSSPSKFKEFYSTYVRFTAPIEQWYQELSEPQALQMSDRELLQFFEKYLKTLLEFWNHSLFIDTFDSGIDQQEIQQLATSHGLDAKEVAELTTPVDLTFGNERLLAVLTLAKQLQAKRISADKLPGIVKAFVQNSSEVRHYIQAFDYYRSNYARVFHITQAEVEEELLKYLNDTSLLNQKYEELCNYKAIQQKKINHILSVHQLTTNPLFFFQQLTYWREHRKQMNLKGFHILDRILSPIEQRTGIAKPLLKCLTHEELGHVMKGLITQEQLKHRMEAGVMVSVVRGGYTLIEGEQAKSLQEELESRLRGQLQKGIIKGQVACQGYAKGVARIILNTDDFARFQEGEILVTGMTRPEFLPLMKKAAGIVTNEGGITCHAAIVSRELGKPCIIGTQQATQLIKDGQLVEVRANHGTVRVL